MTRGCDKARGMTLGELMFILLVIMAVLFIINLVIRAPRENKSPMRRASRYKCKTTPDGLIPIKILVLPAEGAVVYGQPDNGSATQRRVAMYRTCFELELRDGFVRIAEDPVSGTGIGWLRTGDVLSWTTKEALRPNRSNDGRKRLDLWKEIGDVGNPASIAWDDLTRAERGRPDVDPEPAPVLEARKGSYRIACIYQTDTGNVGVAIGWTLPLTVPDDVEFYYLVTRLELKRDIEEYTDAIHELSSGASVEHPIMRLLKKFVSVAVGTDDSGSANDAGTLRKILAQLRGQHRITQEQPAETRRDAENMKRRVQSLRRFYENTTNWNAQELGWLPSRYVPGS